MRHFCIYAFLHLSADANKGQGLPIPRFLPKTRMAMATPVVAVQGGPAVMADTPVAAVEEAIKLLAGKKDEWAALSTAHKLDLLLQVQFVPPIRRIEDL